jgi:RNA polymerase sigma-B factor
VHHTTLRPSFTERDAQTAALFAQLARTRSPDEAEAIVEQVVHLYLDLCTMMASRYDGRGIEHDDLVQVARLALVKSIRRYEPGRAPSFAAYAVPTISGELKRWFRDRGWVVRPPRRIQELHADVNAVRGRLEQALGRTASVTDIAEALQTSTSDVREVAVAATGFRPLSLDHPRGENEHSALEGFLARDDDDLDRADDRVCLREALADLGDDERELLLLCYVEGMTQREIARERGVSQMQISRSLRRTTTRLRNRLLDGGGDESLETAS